MPILTAPGVRHLCSHHASRLWSSARGPSFCGAAVPCKVGRHIFATGLAVEKKMRPVAGRQKLFLVACCRARTEIFSKRRKICASCTPRQRSKSCSEMQHGGRPAGQCAWYLRLNKKSPPQGAAEIAQQTCTRQSTQQGNWVVFNQQFPQPSLIDHAV